MTPVPAECHDLINGLFVVLGCLVSMPLTLIIVMFLLGHPAAALVILFLWLLSN